MIDKIGNSHEELVDMIDSIEALGMLPPEYFADLMVCIDTHKKLSEEEEDKERVLRYGSDLKGPVFY
jgi:hypothetical protein|tara:strand:+ start:1533 stop:1733 length:201 start_codon:yes stop_codon:yes gene_type:complete